MPPEFREWFVQFGNSGYVVLYRCDGSQVAILAVRHGVRERADALVVQGSLAIKPVTDMALKN